MKLLIVRHGDPDYSIDSLTPKGWKEVEYLAERLAALDVKEFYVSPKGRAKDTAAPTLKKMGRTAIEKEWLREFEGSILRPDAEGRMIAWDWLPQDWMRRPVLYDKDHWMEDPIMEEGGIRQEYEWVTDHFDQLLAEHGYVREENYYRVKAPNNDTIVFFCHFGLECVLLSHLLGISPVVLWHGLCAAPSSVTTVTTEERRKGIASFRVNAFGDISHLYIHEENPAFAARFCECYDNDEERRD